MKIRSKRFDEGKDVYTAAVERMHHIYNSFDKVVVSFSGGKDSTAVLNIALAVAKERGKLPLEVVFFDEEAIHPPTIEYVQRIGENPDVNLSWLCLEFKHRNACSNEEPFWYTWDKNKKALWTRDMPAQAITEHPKFRKGMSFQEFSPYLYPYSDGRVAMVLGIRTEESLLRYRSVASKKNDNYIQAAADRGGQQYRCSPIYDWSSEDVWRAVEVFDWDYNKTYDIFNQTRYYNNFLKQRVCPPYGEEPLRGLWIYAECFPEMWHKMLARVQGVATAWRYANTELYSSAKAKPEGMSWKDFTHVVLETYSDEAKDEVTRAINTYIQSHVTKSTQLLEEETPHPISGLSWKWLCTIAIRGDFKGRRGPELLSKANEQRARLGITLKEAIKLYS